MISRHKSRNLNESKPGKRSRLFRALCKIRLRFTQEGIYARCNGKMGTRDNRYCVHIRSVTNLFRERRRNEHYKPYYLLENPRSRKASIISLVHYHQGQVN